MSSEAVSHGSRSFRKRIQRRWRALQIFAALMVACGVAGAEVLWSDLGPVVARATGAGKDILHGERLKRDDNSNDTLYFKFHVCPLSDILTEGYLAGFVLYEGKMERLGIGSSPKSRVYGAFNTSETNSSFVNLASPKADRDSRYESPRRGNEHTIIFKVEYCPGRDDAVTAWLDPNVSAGATEASQPTNLVSRFTANASFDQLHLRHEGGGGGWIFSEMAIATSFDDFVAASPTEPREASAAPPLTFRFWRQEQGFSGSVSALTQTHDGYIWLGTIDGVERFDGVRFVSFGLHEGLHCARVRALLEDKKGALWIGSTSDGLTRLQDGQFATFNRQNGFPADGVTALVEDGEGRLWVGTEEGVVVWQDNHVAEVPGLGQFTGKTITSMCSDQKKILLLSVEGMGVFERNGERFVPMRDPAVQDVLPGTRSMLVDKSGRLWLGVGDDLVLCRDRGNWRRYRISHRGVASHVKLAEGGDGSVWAGSSSEGLVCYQRGKTALINTHSGLSDDAVQALLIDRERHAWLGTDLGLNEIKRGSVSSFAPGSKLAVGSVQSMVEMEPGVFLVSKPGEGIYRWETDGAGRLTPANLLPDSFRPNLFYKTRGGDCWVGGNQGLYRLKGSMAVVSENQTPVLSGEDVVALCEKPDGSILAGTRKGALWQGNQNNWTQVANFNANQTITALAVDLQGVRWVGTDGNGLFGLQSGKPLRFGKTNGLLSGTIRVLKVDSRGVLWIGTAGGGLSRWQGGQITTFTTREGLPGNTVSQIFEDREKRIWLGTDRGIACIERQEFERLGTGGAPFLYPRVYGRVDGMVSEQCSTAGLATSSGQFCFSTANGLAIVDPSFSSGKKVAPILVIEEVIVDGEVQARAPLAARSLPAEAVANVSATAEPLLLKAGSHRIEIRYSGLSSEAPERTHFRYQLESLDANWVEAGTRRTVLYSYVPPGRYQFRVTARNNDGVWNEGGGRLDFIVPQYFWLRRSVLGAAGLMLLASVGIGARLVEKRRMQRRLQQLEQERAMDRERARIAQDLHDDLGASLARISLLSGLARADKDDPAKIEKHFTGIAQSADDSMRAIEEIIWAVRPGSDSLQSVIEFIAHYASELFDGTPTRCRLDLPEVVPVRTLKSDFRHNVFLFVKEALANVLRHAEASEVNLRIDAAQDAIEIVIKDNGKGFDQQGAVADGVQDGLGNLRQRARALNGKLTLQSAPGNGTTVRLDVPFPASQSEEAS